MRVIILTVAIGSLLNLPLSTVAQVPIQQLTAGSAISREIGEGETHSYRIAVESGTFLRTFVHQRTTDVKATLSGPDGRALGEVNNRTGFRRPHRIFLVAAESGDYRIDVTLMKRGAPTGTYEIEVAELRAATPDDEKLVDAERSLAEAGRLSIEQKPESLARALDEFKNSVALFQSIRNLQGEAEAQSKICELHFMTGRINEATPCLERSMELWRSLGAKREEAQARTGVATLHQIQGNLHAAMAEQETALALQRDAGDRFGEGQSLNNLGVASSSVGELQKALEYYQLGIQVAEELKDRQLLAHFLGNRGTAYSRLGDQVTAIVDLERSSSIFRDLNLKRNLAGDLDSLGQAHLRAGNIQKGLNYFQESIELSKAVGDRRLEMATQLNTGGAYSEMGNFDKAFEYYELALNGSRQVRDRRGEAFILKAIGSGKLKVGEIEKAGGHLAEALTIFRDIGDRLGQAAVLADLAQVDRAQGRLTEGLKQIEEAVDLAQEARRRVISPHLRARFRAAAQTIHETHVDLLMLLHKADPDRGYDAEALLATESARGRVLVELLAEAQVDLRQGIDPALLRRERDIRRQLNAREAVRTRLTGSGAPPERLTAIDRDVSSMVAEYERVQAEIRSKNARYAVLKTPAAPGLTQIRSLLGSDTALLEYSLGEDRSYLWLVTKDGMSSFILPPGAEIKKAAEETYELLTARNRRLHNEDARQRRDRIAAANREYPSAAAHLSSILLGPVIERLAVKRLVVVADGPLQLIPFGALPNTRTGIGRRFQPLIERYEIVSLSSASVLASDASARRTNREGGVAIIADPVFDAEDSRVASASTANRKADIAQTQRTGDVLTRSMRDFGGGFRRLRFSRTEAEAIAELTEKDRTFKALDFSANRDAVTGDRLKDYGIVHFATHGLINTRHPELSGLVLSLVDSSGTPRDGFLRLNEIYNMDLNANLVVLSACQSALGKDLQGEGLLGLTRGFIYAGARQVAASLWSVEDQATAELMKRFYSKVLVSGMRPSGALRAAQLEMRSQRQWSAPYHWAGFVIQGDWR